MFGRCLGIVLMSISFACARSENNASAISMQKIVKPGARKILIVSSSNIGGHASMVKALTALLKNTHEVHIVLSEHLCRFSQESFVGNYYESMGSKPAMTYLIQSMHQIWQKFSRKLPTRIMNKLYKMTEFAALLNENNYSLVIFTSPAHIDHVHKISSRSKIPSLMIAADFGEPEPGNMNIWIRSQCNINLVPNLGYFGQRHSKNRLTNISGIPVRPEFQNIRRISKKHAKRNIGIDPNIPCVLVMTGAAGMRNILDIADHVKNDTNKTYVFICGHNQEAYAKLSNMNLQHLLVLKYVEKPMMYMRAADVLISKPGATSISEAIQCETACLFKEENSFPFMRFLPTEEPTARYVFKNEMGDVISEYEEVVPTINKMVRRKYYFPYNNALEHSVYMIRRIVGNAIS